MSAHEKLKNLRNYLGKLGSVAVAFSGGTDSSFLLKIARDVLGDNVLAVTASSASFPERELHEAKAFADKYGIRHVVIASEELDIEGFPANPPDRCYLCKKELFGKIKQSTRSLGILHIVEASNLNDLGDYRPGLRAITEHGILSPLIEAGLTKEDIRALSKEMDLATWNKPSFACLASRFPYGQTINREKLIMVDKAEQYLFDLGFRQVRVRHHGDVARIELMKEEIPTLFEKGLADKIYAYFSGLGFTFTAVDIIGYRTGSMNENIVNLRREFNGEDSKKSD
ncbi:MAG: ATP-dependent sacrificial sulfur transferase LarE [Bacillota bacterium]|nr:ATP-dependent sacrificial sulfur transferase LarE [Bacillota bacterium]